MDITQLFYNYLKTRFVIVIQVIDYKLNDLKLYI